MKCCTIQFVGIYVVFLPSLWPLALNKCMHIIYDFVVESPKEPIGELSFAIGTFSGDDIFSFSSMFGAWFHELW